MDTSIGIGGKKIISAAINAATEARKKSKHLSGAEGSCAVAIPRDGRYMMIVISDQRVSFWDFGMTMREVPPTEIVAFPRSSVSGIVATGETDQYGHMTRFSFVDDSFVDLKLMESPTNAEFSAAAAGLSS
jgi:hypothetical protein